MHVDLVVGAGYVNPYEITQNEISTSLKIVKKMRGKVDTSNKLINSSRKTYSSANMQITFLLFDSSLINIQ